MANKQINELAELTAVEETDLLVVYDVDEAGLEKTKKILKSNFLPYIEGTFTPEIADATTEGNVATAATNVGTYTRVGRLVTVECTILNIDTTGMTGGSTLYVRNLPYSLPTVKSTQSSVSLGHVTFSGMVTMYGIPSTNYLRLLQSTSGAAWTVLTVGSLSSGNADIVFTLTYSV